MVSVLKTEYVLASAEYKLSLGPLFAHIKWHMENRTTMYMRIGNQGIQTSLKFQAIEVMARSINYTVLGSPLIVGLTFLASHKSF